MEGEGEQDDMEEVESESKLDKEPVLHKELAIHHVRNIICSDIVNSCSTGRKRHNWSRLEAPCFSVHCHLNTLGPALQAHIEQLAGERVDLIHSGGLDHDIDSVSLIAACAEHQAICRYRSVDLLRKYTEPDARISDLRLPRSNDLCDQSKVVSALSHETADQLPSVVS